MNSAGAGGVGVATVFLSDDAVVSLCECSACGTAAVWVAEGIEAEIPVGTEAGLTGMGVGRRR